MGTEIVQSPLVLGKHYGRLMGDVAQPGPQTPTDAFENPMPNPAKVVCRFLCMQGR
jgi:hypothetical protein